MASEGDEEASPVDGCASCIVLTVLLVLLMSNSLTALCEWEGPLAKPYAPLALLIDRSFVTFQNTALRSWLAPGRAVKARNLGRLKFLSSLLC